MKKVYLILAATVGMTLASCTTNDYVGEEANIATVDDGSIKFGFDMQNATRADIAGAAAADLLGKNFYVTGTKGEEAATYPTKDLVFDNYLVSFTANTAGKTASNTANWEYVGVTPGTGNWANYAKLGNYSAQTIKYWDYSTEQYDFLAFSTGNKKAVDKTDLTGTGPDPIANDEIGVTKMNYGASLASNGTAYTFYLPTVDALKQTYVSNITEVKNANYGKEVTLRFKNLGSKVRVALYETVPGYSVTDVKFYQVDAATVPTDLKTATKVDEATLISGTGGLPTRGEIKVFFPAVGNNNGTKKNYNVVAGEVSPTSANIIKYKGFGTLYNFATKEDAEPDNDGADPTPHVYKFIGRTLPTATFAGSSAADFYETMFPVSSSEPLTLRVDYTLVSIDGSKETIKVYGAKAVVPSTYTKWEPNYAYTYIFKISDNTNGWTTLDGISVDNQGLFPITFDAVVAEATDADFEQTTITTVAVPTITTYQQNHKKEYPNEYSKATGKDIYVQVMNNNVSPATLYTNLSATNSLLYKVSDAAATEAAVMDALQKRTTTLGATNVTGRNGIKLSKNSNIDNDVEVIVNGADDTPITVTKNTAAKLPISSLLVGTYAYVYDYTTGPTTTVTEYQPFTPGAKISAGYKKITIATLNGLSVTTSDEIITDAIYKDYIYFSKTTNGTGTTTYSYISLAGKKGTTMPAGVVKVAKSTLETTVADETTNSSTFYFDKYFSNNGKYAVKVIKVVD